MKSQIDGLGLKAGVDDGRWLKDNQHNHGVCRPEKASRSIVNLQEMTCSRMRRGVSCCPTQACSEQASLCL